ncbi:AraC family transcriptional regulator [Arhodomonas sp. AD133]|uniref:AraC family transcriptional regulator n=1 Tax=Arhodomonas sp. AD133 TaxID=3415009 RepID=UPI003EBA2C86
MGSALLTACVARLHGAPRALPHRRTDRLTHDNTSEKISIYASPLGETLHDAVCRLVAAVSDPTDRKVLAPMAEREVLYRLLMGEQGDRLREIALQDSHAHRVAGVVRFLQANHDRPLDIATIAQAANMSPSTLHHTFKAVTASSPLQFLKKIRLHQARLLMLHDGMGAGTAAHRVGYASEFQFSREYRRLFGAPPMRDVATLRAEALDQA